MTKRIVVCSDGTWNKWESGNEMNTNVARLWKALLDNPDQGQIVKYDAGVGTGIFKFIGGATGAGISENICQCYRFIVENYNPGDKIYLFGFSRGAYTVRAVAGLMYGCGLLNKAHIAKVKDAYDAYCADDADARTDFKRMHSYARCAVEMVGVWDTVGALGIPLNWLNRFNPMFKEFKDKLLNPEVKHAYHALAIDEKRKTFAPTLWDEDNASADQVIEQVWFTGVHSDVGGGYESRGLPDITLDWMMKKAEQHGLSFNPDTVKRVDPAYFDDINDSRSGIFRLSRKQDRVIRPSPSTPIHVAVEQRAKDEDVEPHYKPVNVLAPRSLDTHYRPVGEPTRGRTAADGADEQPTLPPSATVEVA